MLAACQHRANRLLRFVNHTDYKFFFSGPILFYSYVYTNWRYAYISRLFEKDKYGISINYFSVSLSGLLIRTANTFLELISSPEKVIENNNKEHCDDGCSIHGVRKQITIDTFFTLSKCLAFNLIFMNNTSELQIEQQAHGVGLIFFAGWSLVHNFWATKPEDRWFSWFITARMLTFTYFYLKWGGDADKLKEPNIKLNIATNIAGALALSDTIYGLTSIDLAIKNLLLGLKNKIWS